MVNQKKNKYIMILVKTKILSRKDFLWNSITTVTIIDLGNWNTLRELNLRYILFQKTEEEQEESREENNHVGFSSNLMID